MRPHFSLYLLAALNLACILCGFTNLHAQNAGGFKFLEVKVVDPDGKPMADVPVEISIGEINFPMPTDEKGIVAVNVPTGEGAEVAIQVRHKDFVAMGVGWRGDKKIPEGVTIPLSKGVSFGGIVHDEQGQPVEGVEVSGEMVIENRHGLVNDGKVMPYLDGELAKTDKEGRWQCSMAPDGDLELQLNFSHPDYLHTQYKNKNGDFDGLTSRNEIVVLEKGVSYQGQVFDPDGRPVEQAEVTVSYSAGHESLASRTNADGKFSISNVPKGEVTMSVVAANFAPLQKKVVDSLTTEALRLQLSKGRPLSIQVVNAAGKPLVGARVMVTDWLYPRNGFNLMGNVDADEQGIWRWNNAPAEELTYVILYPGTMETEIRLIPNNKVQKVVVPPEVTITGKVIDKDTRNPIEKFKVTQLLWIDCGQTEGKDCLVVRVSNVAQDSGDYTFESGARCKQFKMLCEAEGYEETGSRIMHTDERKIVFDFELEPKKSTK